MKRGVLFVVGLSLVATGAFAQNQAAIDKALMAAPNRAKVGSRSLPPRKTTTHFSHFWPNMSFQGSIVVAGRPPTP